MNGDLFPRHQILILGLLVLLFWIDPLGTYHDPMLQGPLALVLVVFLVPHRSPWVDWWGALPYDRSRWLNRALAQTIGAQALMQLAFWAALGLLTSGPGGWPGFLQTHGALAAAGLWLTPWPLALGLSQRTGQWVPLRPVRLGGALLLAGSMAALGGSADQLGGAMVVQLAAGGFLISAVLARLRCRHLLFQGERI